MNKINFESELTADVYGLNKFIGIEEVESYWPKVTIYWSIEPEIRPDKVNGFVISIDRVKGFIHWGSLNKDESMDQGEQSMDTQDRGENWTIECLMEFDTDGSISPKTIEIDFEKLKIVIE